MLLAQGIAIGLAVAAPIGPVNVLCIRHTLARGMRVGLVTGLGAVLADTLFAAMVAGGFMVASFEGLAAAPWARSVGGLVLIGSGARSFTQKTRRVERPAGGFLASFALAASNPMLLMSIAAIFAAAGLGTTPLTGREAVAVVTGVALGSTAWWLGLTALVGQARRRFPDGLVRKAERVCAVLLVGTGVLVVASAWIHRLPEVAAVLSNNAL